MNGAGHAGQVAGRDRCCLQRRRDHTRQLAWRDVHVVVVNQDAAALDELAALSVRPRWPGISPTPVLTPKGCRPN